MNLELAKQALERYANSEESVKTKTRSRLEPKTKHIHSSSAFELETAGELFVRLS
jgi:hypothetical protein